MRVWFPESPFTARRCQVPIAGGGDIPFPEPSLQARACAWLLQTTRLRAQRLSRGVTGPWVLRGAAGGAASVRF